MARYFLALVTCLGLASVSAGAAGSQGMDAVMRHYDASAVAEGKIQVSAAGDVAWVSGTSDEGPWLAVWQRTGGEWKKIREVVRTQLTPIRFGVKREKPCRS
jgi:hypothetical protein